MGFRNPFRIQVDEHDVAYVTDYSPDSAVPENFRGPAGTGPGRDRAQAVQLRLAAVRRRRRCPTTAGTSTPASRWTRTPTQHECDNPTRGPQNESRWNTGLEYGPPVAQPDLWYSFRDNANPPLGTPCLASYDGSGGSCPQLFPELAGAGGVGAARRGQVPLRRGQPERDEVPAVLRRRGLPGRVHATTSCARSVSARATRSSRSTTCSSCGDVSADREHAAVRVRRPDGHAVRARRRVLPARPTATASSPPNPDAGMYRFEYVGGTARAAGPARRVGRPTATPR